MKRAALTCLVIGAAGMAVTAAGAGAGAEPAAGGRTYAASAEAEGLRVTFDAPQFLVVSTLFDAANPISQATLESTGVSRSFASAPYPGDLVVTAPGTLAAFGGPSLPAGYPFYVAASQPDTPKASLADPAGAYSLTAVAGPAASAATGRLAVPKGPTVHTEARTVQQGDGSVRAVATSVVEGLAAGDGALTIGRVVSTVETVSRPGSAAPEVRRTFEITGARVGDTAVDITPDGVKVPGGSVPVASAAAPVQAALARAGIDVKVEGDEALQGGGTARTLVIRSHQQAPLPGAPTGVLTVRVGGAATAVLTGAAAAVDVPGSPGAAAPLPASTLAPPPGGGDAAPLPSGAAPAGAGAAATAPPGGAGDGTALTGAALGSPLAGGSAPGGSPGAGPETGGPAAATGPSGAALGAGTEPIFSVPSARPVRRAVRSLFAVLAAGGALVLAGSAAFRRQGVQSPWMF
ncbi:MAG TPA: hypothetical protein VFE55_11370 [Acidimicrobiia bacterium]|nr:hypothetical protein [Acidimicrobiia bacterium]